MSKTLNKAVPVFNITMRWKRKVLITWLITGFFLIIMLITMNAHAGDFDTDEDFEAAPYGMPRLASFLINSNQKKRMKKAVRYRQISHESHFDTTTKYILLYNDFFGAKDWTLGLGDTLFKRLQCPVRNCALMWGRSKMKHSSAVLFHVPRLNPILPKIRPPGQVWIFFSLESPANVPKLPEYWRGQFNWTMTYNQKSDFQISFGKFVKREFPRQRNWTEVVMQKSKMVAWFVSNCDHANGRMEYVKRLQKIVPVDIFGKCGRDECPKNNKQECEEMLNTSYKFYLAFENSICEDYITEKVFAYSKNDVTIIVRGGANYTDLAPPNSFIRTSDFRTPEDLGQYLLYLDKNPREHARYLEWKNEWDSIESGLYQNTWCDVCKALHEPQKHTPRGDPYDLWFSKNQCWNVEDLK